MTRVASGAAEALGGMRARMEGELRDQSERLLARMNLVTREEFNIVSELARTARLEQEKLAVRVAALESQLAASIGAIAEKPVTKRRASPTKARPAETDPARARPASRRRSAP